MSMNGKVKVKYIGEDGMYGFKRDEIYEMTRPICDRPERFLCYTESGTGEKYAISADLFEILCE